MKIRPARDSDAAAIAAIVLEGDATFGDFAPPGWTPPAFEVELHHARDAVASPHRWIAVAVVGDEVVGYTTFVAARLTRVSSDEPGLAHLGRLFVRPAHWGTGVATALNAAAVAAASAHGYCQMRLFTPTGHARARRFYEREGWRAVAELPESELGLPLTEYRRALGSRRR
jgi:GNAT superfamily N-acetyltransferase